MEIKEFERYLELLRLKKEYFSNTQSGDKGSEPFAYNKELYDLKIKLQNFIFENQSGVENTISKLKTTLDCLGGTYSGYYGSYGDSNKVLNEVKAVREILSLLDTYDWKLMYSEHDLDGSGVNKQVAVWEQNGDGQIRNRKKWIVSNHISDNTRDN